MLGPNASIENKDEEKQKEFVEIFKNRAIELKVPLSVADMAAVHTFMKGAKIDPCDKAYAASIAQVQTMSMALLDQMLEMMLEMTRNQEV